MTITFPPSTDPPRTGPPDSTEPPTGGGGGDSVPASPLPLLRSEHFIMVLALITSSMLFAGWVGALIVLRGASSEWPPPGSPALPTGLWWSTAVLLLSSASLGLAQRAIRRGLQQSFKRLLCGTTLLGTVFLVLQFVWWRGLHDAGFEPRTDNFMGMFYMLTWAHAAHLLTALAWLGLVTVRALKGRYSPRHHLGVELASMLWHFLGLVWLAVFALLSS